MDTRLMEKTLSVSILKMNDQERNSGLDLWKVASLICSWLILSQQSGFVSDKQCQIKSNQIYLLKYITDQHR